MHKLRDCKRCGKPVFKHRRESFAQFHERKYCCSECSFLHQRENAAKRVENIAKMRAHGMSLSEIAKREGISLAQVKRLSSTSDIKNDERVEETKRARAIMDAPLGWHAAQLRCLPECEIELMRRLQGKTR